MGGACRKQSYKYLSESRRPVLKFCTRRFVPLVLRFEPVKLLFQRESTLSQALGRVFGNCIALALLYSLDGSAGTRGGARWAG
ncbi:hypothetical protein RV134_320109 [Roseovarius sp. EC-HK134]|nr:hypothetical protein RV420_380038 [Roseovarius sp. EC-SD190]VVT23237.1 hypothetical protein RV134_320109 [Roseovarius sp. EC-HK134]